MPKVSTIQSSFNGGEISPLLLGRVDVPRYKESLAICLNYIPLIQGPKTRRPGTSFVFPTKFPNAVARLIPFQFSTEQAYMLEFGNEYIRFFKDYGIITQAPENITGGITNANPAVVTIASHGFSNGDHIVFNGVLGMTELDNREFQVANTTTNTFTLIDNITGLPVDSTLYAAYTSGGNAAKIFELGSAFLTSELQQINFTQSDDVLYLAHPSHFPSKLTRLSDTNWILNVVGTNLNDNINMDGPYYPQNTTSTTLTIVKTNPSHEATVTAVGSDGINDGQGFLATDVGRILRIYDSSVTMSWQSFVILSYSSSTVVFVQQYADNGNETATENMTLTGAFTIAATVDWRMGFWSATDGYPTAVVFHEDRLVYGGAGGDPTRFDGSNSSDYENFAPTKNDGTTISADMSYSFSLASNDVNGIVWETSDEQGLLIGTTGGEWLVTSADGVSALSATSVSAKKTTSYGSETIQAVQSGKSSLFIQRGGRKLRELNYYFDVNGFRASDLTQMSEHITQSRVTGMAVQKSPQPIVWCTRNDGTLAAMTYERDLDALKVGWSRHIMGGVSSGGGQTICESVAVIPDPTGEFQDVWVIVQRQINGSTVRYLEYITQLFDNNTPLSDAFFVDAGLTYSGSPTNEIQGLNHLNGQTVSILADGSPQPNAGVVNGRVSLPLGVLASTITIGLAYNSDGQKLRSDAGSADGTGMGKTRRIHRIGIQFLNTLGFMVGPDFNTLDEVTLDSTDAGVLSNTSQALFTGIATMPVTNDYDFDNMFCWRQNQPLPGTLLGIYPQQVTQDRS